MKYYEILKYVEEKNCSAYAISHEKKEVYIIVYEKGSEAFADTIVWTSGDLTGEGCFDTEEFYFIFEDEIEQMDFIPAKKDVINLKKNYFSTVLEEIESYKL